MNVGFTGTREGMTDDQLDKLDRLLRGFRQDIFDSSFLHGNCVGADEQALTLARNLNYRTVAYPTDIPSMQIELSLSDYAKDAEKPLVRNRHIVRDCDVLIAAPKESTEPEPARGQGTWSTVRYARKQNLKRRTYIIWPDGKLEVQDAGSISP